MSLESQFKSKILLVRIEPLTVIKNEPEIGMDQDFSADIKDEIDIEYHSLSEDLIKSEPIPNNLLESERLESITTQMCIQTENTPFIKTKFENLVKTRDTNDGNLSVVSGSTRKKRKAKMDNCRLKYHFNKCKYKTLRRRHLEKHKVINLKPNEIQYLCYHCSYKSNRKGNLKKHIFGHFNREEVPFHCYICNFVTSKRNLIIKHFKKHPEHRRKWDKTEYKNQHFRCNQCKYKTLRKRNLEKHQVIHLNPNKFQYFCYHCLYKNNNKYNLRSHIFNHFKKGEVPFHCYICNFVTSKRNLIIKHFKKHPEHRSKWNETEYNNQAEAYFKTGLRYNYCKKCLFRTHKYAEFKLHELSHEGERDDQHLTYPCDQCKYKTFRPGDLKIHKKLVHLEPEKISYLCCYHCPYECKHKSNLRQHIWRHFKREEVAFHCYICDFVTKKRDLIIEHFKKHPEHVSKCDETDYEMNLKLSSNFKRRYKLREVEMHQCDKCTYKTFRKYCFKNHKLTHLKPEEIQWFYCYHCSYKVKRKGDLQNHILRHFKNEVVKFHCYICDFVTKKRDLIFEHFKKHPEHISKCDETDYKKRYKLTQKSKVKMDDQYLKYQCDKCTYKTFSRRCFNNHKLVHLKPEEIQWFYCYHCSHKAKRKSKLKYHILRHFKNEVVKFHCYICDFVTKKRHLIFEHFKKHPEHISKCDETDYKKRYELTQKSKVKMDDQYLKYQCDKCTYKTFRKQHFENHKLIHLKPEEIQWFYCYHCSYKAKQKAGLKRHIWMHFKKEVVKFHCYMCNFMTLKRKSITEHIKKHSKVQVKSKINQKP